jgi:hypothetical protein
MEYFVWVMIVGLLVAAKHADAKIEMKARKFNL